MQEVSKFDKSKMKRNSKPVRRQHQVIEIEYETERQMKRKEKN